MSGIAGILAVDGRPIDPLTLRRLTAGLARRGLERESTWSEGSIGMGHRLLRVTPESASETQPLSNAEGTLRIHSQARIDNRGELLAELGDPRLRDAPDVALILASFERFGPRCVDRLIGDFAFAIWDTRRRRLFCARDRMGICPFHYTFDGQRFPWSSEVGNLLELTGRCEIDETILADYLVGNRQRATDSFYRGIHRLPAAHTLVAEPGGSPVVQRYWDLEPDAAGAPIRDRGECIERFLGLLEEVVRSKLRSCSPVAVLMSGGLDSTAIVGVAERIRAKDGSERRVIPVSAVFDQETAVDERPWIRAMSERHRLEIREVVAEAYPSFSAWRQTGMPPLPSEPLEGKFHEMNCGLLRNARQAGAQVALTGAGADVLLEGTPLLLVDLLRHGEWRHLRSELSGWPVRKLIDWVLGYGKRPLAQVILGSWPPRITRHFFPLPDWLEPSFARRMRVRERLAESYLVRRRFRDLALEEDYHAIMSAEHSHRIVPIQDAGLYYGMELRHPFYDSRLVEFLFGAPAEFKNERGVPKSLLRHAMRGILPTKLTQDGRRGGADPLLDRGLEERLQGGERSWLTSGALVRQGYVRSAPLAAMVDAFLSGHRERRHELGRVAQLELWLERVTGA